MRDFRDSKAMAQSLRQALSERAVTVTHSESLELIAKTFGLDNWNILAAQIEAARPPAPQPAAEDGPKTLCCSFCGKSQHDVQSLIAGPAVFICNECVGLCDGILLDQKIGKEIAADQARFGHPALILVTAFDARNRAQRAVEAGFSAYLLKPVEEDRLLAPVARAKRHRGALVEQTPHRR